MNKYVFVGNRKFVLQEMLSQGLTVEKIYVVKGSHLDKENSEIADRGKIRIIASKQDLLNDLSETDYDILISNGCPYIFPNCILNDDRKYINIHPSYLPNLRGVDPVIGAVLYHRDAGATCHYINEQIDAGDIISQIKIPMTYDIDVRLLYQLSFIAERQVFIEAHNAGFLAKKKQFLEESDIYYKRSAEDMLITFHEPLDFIINKVKAFNNRSQGAFFKFQGDEYRVYRAKRLDNDYLVKITEKCLFHQVCLCYEDCIVVKQHDGLLLLDRINRDLSRIHIGALLGVS